jgi:hypothetical protein
MKNKRRGEQGISSYELFIGGLSVLSILNLVLLVLPISGQAKQLILIVDVALTAIFRATSPFDSLRRRLSRGISLGAVAGSTSSVASRHCGSFDSFEC